MQCQHNKKHIANLEAILLLLEGELKLFVSLEFGSLEQRKMSDLRMSKHKIGLY